MAVRIADRHPAPGRTPLLLPLALADGTGHQTPPAPSAPNTLSGQVVESGRGRLMASDVSEGDGTRTRNHRIDSSVVVSVPSSCAKSPYDDCGPFRRGLCFPHFTRSFLGFQGFSGRKSG